MTKFSFDNLQTTYNGLDHACRCGCKGTYAEPTVPTEYAAAKRRFNAVMHQHSMFPVNVQNGFGNEVFMDLKLPNNRATTVYFK